MIAAIVNEVVYRKLQLYHCADSKTFQDFATETADYWCARMRLVPPLTPPARPLIGCRNGGETALLCVSSPFFFSFPHPFLAIYNRLIVFWELRNRNKIEWESANDNGWSTSEKNRKNSHSPLFEHKTVSVIYSSIQGASCYTASGEEDRPNALLSLMSSTTKPQLFTSSYQTSGSLSIGSPSPPTLWRCFCSVAHSDGVFGNMHIVFTRCAHLEITSER